MRLRVVTVVLLFGILFQLAPQAESWSWMVTGPRTRADIIRDLKWARSSLQSLLQQMKRAQSQAEWARMNRYLPTARNKIKKLELELKNFVPPKTVPQIIAAIRENGRKLSKLRGNARSPLLRQRMALIEEAGKAIMHVPPYVLFKQKGAPETLAASISGLERAYSATNGRLKKLLSDQAAVQKMLGAIARG